MGLRPSVVILLWLLLSTLNSQLSTVFAQSYSIDWSTIDGGGGTSTGGVYSASGIPQNREELPDRIASATGH